MTIFTYNDNKTSIKCLTSEKLINICAKFASIIKKNISKFNFKYNGNIINKELKYEEFINEKDRNSINITIEEIKDENMNNYIIGEIYIKEEDINKDIRNINSLENLKREKEYHDASDDYKLENEKEIKEKIIIKINNNIIDFNYYYKFKESGKYEIKYIFKENIGKTDYMFYGCKIPG